MSRQTRKSQRRAPDVKGPLAVSAVLAVVAGGVTSFVAAGGTDDGMRLDLGLIVGGVAFIASVVVCATLMMLDKPNPTHLGEGTGVNRSSAKLYAERRAQRQKAAGREASAQTDSDPSPQHGVRPTGPDSTASDSRRVQDSDGGPQYGQRIYPEQ